MPVHRGAEIQGRAACISSEMPAVGSLTSVSRGEDWGGTASTLGVDGDRGEEAEEVTERASSAAKGGARRRGKRPSARHRWAGSHPPNEAPCPGQKLGRRALPTGTRAGNEGLRWSPALQWPPARGGRGDLLGEEWGRRSEPSLHSRDTETPEVEGLRMLHLDPKSTGYGRGDAPAADLVGRWAGGLSPSGYQKLEGQFDYRAFVSVSQKPDMKKILRNNTLPVQLPRVWWYPLHLQEVSNEILKKCGGLPLAIITISSLLATKARTKEEWEKIWKSIGVVLENDTGMEEMNKILSLSYNDLPYHLKTCLLYLSVFPEDYEIKRDRLIRRWIAEGFITTEGGQDMEEIGECYFNDKNDLINRSMIQPVGIQHDGRAEACRVHDMILDLITSKSVEENFVTLCGDQNQKLMQQDKIRRLSLNYYARDDIMLPKNLIVSNVRSLTTFGYSENMPCLSKFQLLRVLDLENRVALEYKYLKHIGKLFHLSLELPEGIEGISISSNGFHCLKEFYFSCWEIGTGLTFEPGAMPLLEKLRIPFNAHGVFSLHGILDFGIQYLSSLKHLEVEIVYHGARHEEVEAMEEAVKKAASDLSDELSLDVRRWDEEILSY
ncbi:hypothetical protein HU200_003331 [Digitaria exilis]|uniref:NB-ARC domain-containing protein n=1 Tax=Digitaria exilis TaxID=1010633 RepID=A0A835FX13_9POAL|nr:hypothetical protein HU200_003331 [Digitaria exilis]